MSPRVVLADDHRLFRDGLRPLLAGHPDIEVVGETEDGLEALALCRDLQPEVAVLDIAMNGLNGIEVTRRLAREVPDVRVIILSMHGDRRFVLESLRAGARGYVLKDASFDELLAAVTAVVAGRLHLSAAVGDEVLQDYVNRMTAESGTAFAVLSAREREVLQLLAEGLATKQVAARLCLSAKTVESHRRSLMAKLDLHSVAELTKYAIRQGLTTLE